MADLKDMTLDQLDTFSTVVKGQITELQDHRDEIASARKAKVQEMHEAEATAQLEAAATRLGADPRKLAEEWIRDDQPGHTTQAELYLGIHRSQR